MSEHSRVLGVVKDPRTETLATDLRSAGFLDFEVMEPGALLEQGGGPNTIARLKGEFNDDTAQIEHYEAQAREGNPIVTVGVDDEIQAERARDVLQRNQVTDIRYFGRP
jgi:hypothetical protein